MNQQKANTRRQLVADARAAALAGQWDEAIAINQQIIERSPRDAEAHNRLGRALLSQHTFGPAIEAYTNALRADPANMIARRNLQRLELLRSSSPVDQADGAGTTGETVVMPRTSVFIEEVGKTWVDELVNPAPAEEIASVFPAERLELEVAGDRLIVKRQDGSRLGEIEVKTAERVISLIAGGNRYEAYALGPSTLSLRVIIREVARDPSLATTVSFPRQITSRAYLRERDLLRQRDEADFFLLEDDDDDEETATSSPDDEETPEADAETPFIDESAANDEEESNI